MAVLTHTFRGIKRIKEELLGRKIVSRNERSIRRSVISVTAVL
jgi:hypothetical protein